MYRPYDVVLDSDGNIYVSDGATQNRRVMKWVPGATTGVIIAGGNGNGSANNQFNTPRDLFLDSSNNLYVMDAGNYRIMKWAPGATEGVLVAGGNGYGNDLNQVPGSGGFHVDSSGNIYTPDSNNHRVIKWAPNATEGIVVAGGNGQGSNANQLAYPNDVYVDNLGFMYIAQSGYQGGNPGVIKWKIGESKGLIVAGANGNGSSLNKFNAATDVKLDSAGNILVLDSANHRLQKIQAANEITIPCRFYHRNFNFYGHTRHNL